MKYRTINIILVITNVIALLIIVQITFDLIPLNPFDYDSERIKKINDITLGFSLGYIVSSLFYLFGTVIPHELDKTRVQKIVSPYLSDIYSRLYITQLFFKDKFNCQSINSISTQNLQSFKSLSNSKISFSYQEKNENKYQTVSYHAFTEIDFFEDERDLVLNNIDTILANPFLSGLNDNLIFTLTRLRTEMFYVGVTRHVESKNNSVPFMYMDFEKYVEEHFSLIKDFMKDTEYLKNRLTIKDLKQDTIAQ